VGIVSPSRATAALAARSVAIAQLVKEENNARSAGVPLGATARKSAWAGRAGTGTRQRAADAAATQKEHAQRMREAGWGSTLSITASGCVLRVVSVSRRRRKRARATRTPH
jgi:hypothetical protein